MHLDTSFKATGAVEFIGARITGQLACDGGTFEGALDCNAATIGADVFLRKNFVANGQVDLVRTTVAGNLLCNGGALHGGLRCEGMEVKAGFFWHDLAAFGGTLDLTDAQVGRLHDDPAAWAGAEHLLLSGFRYDRTSGDMRVKERLDVLKASHMREMPTVPPQKHSLLRDAFPFAFPKDPRFFDPQPYAQLAKVLREQGNPVGAAMVLEERERRLARASFRRAMADVDGTWKAGLRGLLAPFKFFLTSLFGVIFAYGHRPSRALWFVLALWLITGLLYMQVWAVGDFAPTSSVILTSADWATAIGQMPHKPLLYWMDNALAAKDYESFKAFLYAFDVFIPLDALGQEAAWAPAPARGFWGTVGFYAKPVIQILGWVITAIGAAAVAGLVGKRE